MAFMIYDVCDLKGERESFFHTCMHLNEALITLFHIHEAAHMRDHATAYESDCGLAPWEFSLVPFLCFLLAFFATQMTYRAIGPPLCKTGQMKTTYWPFLGDCWEKVWGRGVTIVLMEHSLSRFLSAFGPVSALMARRRLTQCHCPLCKARAEDDTESPGQGGHRDPTSPLAGSKVTRWERWHWLSPTAEG